jgi:tRNA-binding protein
MAAEETPANPPPGDLTWGEFDRVEIRVGTVTHAQPLSGLRRPAYAVWVDFGPALGARRSSAQLTRHYTPETLIGRQVLAVVNFPPKQIGRFRSQCLIVGVPDGEGEPVLISPDQPVPDGGRLF